MSVDDTPITLPLNGCARCGGRHDSVHYRVFRNPVPDPEGDFTHWAECPETGDPILMRWIASSDHPDA